MTKAEVQEILQEIKHYLTAGNPVWDVDEIAEACDIAIEALEMQDLCAEMLESAKPVSTDGDLIHRQDIKYHVQLEAMGNGQYEEVEVAYKNDIESLPSAETPTVSEKHQLSEETPTNTPTDLIGRQDVLNMIIVAGECEPDLGYTHLHKVVENIPSAEPKTGRWIDYSDEGYVECPFCHSATTCDGNKDELHFCFSCGARMLGGEEE